MAPMFKAPTEGLEWDAKLVNPYTQALLAARSITDDIDKRTTRNMILDKQQYDRNVVNKTGRIIADIANGSLTSLEGINLDGTDPAAIAKAITTVNNNKSLDTYRKGVVANAAQKITNAQVEADRKRKAKEVSDVALGNYYATLGDTDVVPSTKEVVDNIYPTTKPVVVDEVIVDEPTPAIKEVVAKKNAITTSTVTVDGISHEVTEDRKQRIINQREAKTAVKSMEQRKYEETKTFIKDNPSLAKEAMTSFRSWRKDYRANNVVGSDLTASEKQLVLDKAERDNAAYYNGVGYDSKGKPFYKKDTGNTSTLKPFTYTNDKGQSVTEYRGVTPSGSIISKDGKATDKTVLGTKEATLTQDDKKFLAGFKALKEPFSRINSSVENNKDIFGPVASWFDRRKDSGTGEYTSGVGQLFATKDSKDAALFDEDMNRLKAEVIKSMGANPSDRDLKAIEAMLPTRSDEPDIAQTKATNFRDWYYNKQVEKINRLFKTNPSVANSMIIGNDGTIQKGLVEGYELVRDDGVYSYIPREEK